MQIYAQVTGDKETIKKINLLIQKCEEKVGAIVTMATMKTEVEAKKNSPIKTGRLRSSITHEIINKKKEHFGKVGTDVEYAPHQEFGTVKMKAHPYLFPGLKAGNALLVKKLDTEIRKIK